MSPAAARRLVRIVKSSPEGHQNPTVLKKHTSAKSRDKYYLVDGQFHTTPLKDVLKVEMGFHSSDSPSWSIRIARVLKLNYVKMHKVPKITPCVFKCV